MRIRRHFDNAKVVSRFRVLIKLFENDLRLNLLGQDYKKITIHNNI